MGHIPVSESKELEILTFEESRKVKADSLNYDRDKWIYYPDFYSEYRYILGSVGNNPIIVIGINPSTAEPTRLDNTIKSVKQLSSYNGYSLSLLNKELKDANIELPQEISNTTADITFDIWFNNIFTDVRVQGEIKDSLNKLRKFRKSILEVVKNLDDEISKYGVKNL